MATQEQQQVRDWMSAFGQETPEKPIIPSLEVRRLRAKLILEEALETITALGIGAYVTDEDGEWNCVQDMKFEFSDWGDERASLTEILDGCEDLKVVTEGTLVACGLVVPSESKMIMETEGDQYGIYQVPKFVLIHEDPHFSEVMRSNWSKMWTADEIEIAAQCSSEEFPYPNKVGFYLPNIDDSVAANKVGTTDRCWLVKDSSGKVIKSPSYSAPKFNL